MIVTSVGKSDEMVEIHFRWKDAAVREWPAAPSEWSAPEPDSGAREFGSWIVFWQQIKLSKILNFKLQITN